ncbi:MAG: hypothetical protein M3Y57_22160 [Acidobacteriota bacterium]|nr:hypothetical protein [Acidobacteriota bacterium]
MPRRYLFLVTELSKWPLTLFLYLSMALCAASQTIPDVHCTVEDYSVKATVAWQFPGAQKDAQVVVLRDPAGEQEARFDLLHGAALISLRLHEKELLFGQTAGASVSMFAAQKNAGPELKHLPPYWSAYSPDQGGSSMGLPATTAGVACDGQHAMRAFSMMIDRGVDNSFRKHPLIGVFKGQISDNFPPGYSTPFTIETSASWVRNPSGSPTYYLKLEQSVVNVRPEKTGRLMWYLNAATPWDFQYSSHFPESCSEKSPCSSRNATAIAAGRYRDSTRSDGLAIVAPAVAWHTDNMYVKDNAEYVVLLYNSVWAAPRHTFALVSEHALNGVSSFRFSWYVCAGSWEHVKTFSASQPVSEAPAEPREPESPEPQPEAQALRVGCQTSTFKPQPQQEDQAIVLKDPAGEQTVLFDMSEGGAIVSLRYRGLEHIWGYNGGGLLQMAFHNGMSNGAWSGDYNPTQAGDGSAMSPVTGVACGGSSSVDIITMMLDFNHNNAFYSKPLIAVWGGRVDDRMPTSYFSPYVLETHAEWIPNPSAAPKYYLKLSERLVHVADETIGPFAFDFAAYEPWEFNVRAVSPEHCPCTQEQTRYMAGGWYSDAARDTGLAVAMPSANFPNAKVGGGFNSDYMWRNHNFHLTSREALDGVTAKEFVWYVLPGPWRNALPFAQSLSH